LNDLCHYRFNLRVAASDLPTREFNFNLQRKKIPCRCNDCIQQVIADQNHAKNNCALINQSSIMDLAKKRQIMNPSVHSLLAEGVICANNGYVTKK
jgi:Zn finger protein HypA/HybF involved in hydrogenase expression